MTCKLHDNWKKQKLGRFTALQMYGPDPMHTLSGEVKACFSMLSGSVYCGTTKAAQTIRNYEAETNKRYMPSEVKSACSLCCFLPCLVTCLYTHIFCARNAHTICMCAGRCQGQKEIKGYRKP